MDNGTINNHLTIGNEPTVLSGPDSALGHIDQYELLRELGGGGFGTVYLARDMISGIEVAVKGLPPFVKNNREEMENIRSNFSLVSRLTHTNIAKILVLHPAKDVVYASEDVRDKLRVNSGDTLMVMEYARGVTLSQWRKQFLPGNKVPIAQALEITSQIAAALDYAHERKIVHRDIKPANVMIETAGDGAVTARVLDFGLAAEIRSSMGRVSREIHDTSGTRPYMAPEQWLGGKQGPWTDQYSLAVLFCELVTGEVPFASVFDTGDPIVMMNVVGREPFSPPKGLPKAIRKALAKGLSKKPNDRFASCGDFISALGGPVGSRIPCDRSSAHRLKVFAAVALLATLVGGVCAAVWMKREAREAAIARIRQELYELKGKAGQARDRSAREEWQTWPHFDTRAKDVDAFYRAGVEAFEKDDFVLAKKMFCRVRERMQWLDSNKVARVYAVDARAMAESSREEAERHNAATFASPSWQAATNAYGKAAGLFEHGDFKEARVAYDDATRQFADAAKQSFPQEKKAIWRPGSRHPNNPNLVADVGLDTWRSVRPGYVWVEGTDRDEWKSGLMHPENPRLSSDSQEGIWKSTAYGYVWTGGSRTEWQAGKVINGRKTSSTEGVWLDRCSSCDGKGEVQCHACGGKGWTTLRCTNCIDGFTYGTETTRCTDCVSGIRYERCANNCVRQVDGNWYVRCDCDECEWINGAHGEPGLIFQPCNRCGGFGMILCPNMHRNDGTIQVGRCPSCNGTLQKTVRKKIRCSRCDGTGVVKNKCSICSSGMLRCNRCDGTGWK